MSSFDEDPAAAAAASHDCAPSSPIPTSNPLLRASHPLVTELEQEVLDEYTRLLGNVNKLSDKLAGLAGDPTSLTLDGLRLLERKTATVCTLLKASVYSIVLQQQMINESEEQQQQEQREYEEGQEGQEGQEERFQDDGDVSMTGRYA